MNERRVTSLIAGIGAAVALAGLFWFPWIWFSDRREVEDQLSDSRINLPILTQWLGHTLAINLSDLRQIANLDQLLPDPGLRRIATAGRAQRPLTAWNLWAEFEQTRWPLRMSILAALLVVGLSALCAAPGLYAVVARPIAFGQATCGLMGILAALALIACVPALDTFGASDDIDMALVCVFTGCRSGSGLWVTILGLLIAAVGHAAGATLPVSVQSRGDDISEEERTT